MAGLSVVEITFSTETSWEKAKYEYVLRACTNARQAAKEARGKICYMFKVIGESKLILVTEGDVEEAIGAFRTCKNMGVTSTTCKPVYPYKTFAEEVLGVDASKTDALENYLSVGGPILWFSAHITFKGANFSTLIDRWQREALAVAEAKKGGLECALFKVAGERVVFGAFKISGKDFDKALFHGLPLFKEDHEQINVETRTCSVMTL